MSSNYPPGVTGNEWVFQDGVEHGQDDDAREAGEVYCHFTERWETLSGGYDDYYGDSYGAIPAVCEGCGEAEPIIEDME